MPRTTGAISTRDGVGDGVVFSGQVLYGACILCDGGEVALLAVGPCVAWFGEGGYQRFVARADRVGRPLQQVAEMADGLLDC